jgi:hypothetical protein
MRHLSVNGPDFDVLRPLKQSVDEIRLEHVTVTQRLDQHLRLGDDGKDNDPSACLALPEQPVKKLIVRFFPVEEIDQRAGIEAEPAGPG